MILAAVILKEPITGKKALGVLMGCSGALILILTSAAATTDKVGDIRGDLLCLGRWMFLWATVIVIPLTMPHLLSLRWSAVTVSAWWEAAYVVVFGTFIGYILTMIGQRTLRPTVVSIYNYVQPIVSVTVSIITGIGIFRWSQALARKPSQ